MPTVSSCSRVESTTEKINGDVRRFYKSLGFSVNNGKVWYRVETRPDLTVQPSYESCDAHPAGHAALWPSSGSPRRRLVTTPQRADRVSTASGGTHTTDYTSSRTMYVILVTETPRGLRSRRWHGSGRRAPGGSFRRSGKRCPRTTV